MVHTLQLLNDSGVLALIVSVIATIFMRVNPLIKKKIEQQKASKAYAAYQLLDKFAENAVADAATKYELPSDQKRETAIAQVTKQLSDHNVSIDPANVSAAIEKAYQYFSTKPVKAKVNQQVYDEGAKKAQSTDNGVDAEKVKELSAQAESIQKQLATLNANAASYTEPANKDGEDNAKV